MHPRTRSLAAGSIGLGAALGAGGCGVSVRAPDLPPGEPAVAVYVADYGRHSSLLLPRDGGLMSEYAFGQWDWYALGRREWWRGPRVLLLPSRPTLGTRDVAAPDNAADLVRRLGLESAFALRVSESEAISLRRDLDDRIAAASTAVVYNPEFGLEFVPADGVYWLPYNCNTAVAAWLRDLGCGVGGLAILSEFRVRPARAAPGGTATVPAPPDGPSFPPLPR